MGFTLPRFAAKRSIFLPSYLARTSPHARRVLGFRVPGRVALRPMLMPGALQLLNDTLLVHDFAILGISAVPKTFPHARIKEYRP